ncbi:MAG: hypothetical protein LRZ84_14720 [Desertifilum sp.]|nr:hypothetical protein [Desertifilum sp.]
MRDKREWVNDPSTRSDDFIQIIEALRDFIFELSPKIIAGISLWIIYLILVSPELDAQTKALGISSVISVVGIVHPGHLIDVRKSPKRDPEDFIDENYHR